MEIVKVGTFVEGGYPQGWSIHPTKECKEGDAPALGLPPNGDVFIGGILMRELTEERKQKMEQPK